MPIGIIGAGAIGQALAGRFVAAGERVVISNSRGPASLRDLIPRLGPGLTPATVAEAAVEEIAVLAEASLRAGWALAVTTQFEGSLGFLLPLAEAAADTNPELALDALSTATTPAYNAGDPAHREKILRIAERVPPQDDPTDRLWILAGCDPVRHRAEARRLLARSWSGPLPGPETGLVHNAELSRLVVSLGAGRDGRGDPAARRRPGPSAALPDRRRQRHRGPGARARPVRERILDGGPQHPRRGVPHGRGGGAGERGHRIARPRRHPARAARRHRGGTRRRAASRARR